jgi:hypothetical protein
MLFQYRSTGTAKKDAPQEIHLQFQILPSRLLAHLKVQPKSGSR